MEMNNKDSDRRRRRALENKPIDFESQKELVKEGKQKSLSEYQKRKRGMNYVVYSK